MSLICPTVAAQTLARDLFKNLPQRILDTIKSLTSASVKTLDSTNKLMNDKQTKMCNNLL